MADLYRFEPMLGPAEEFPPGSVEWAMRISNRLQTGTRFITKHTAQHIGATMRQIWDARPRPWEVWPEGKPFGTPDDYCRAVTGFEWDVLRATVAGFVPQWELDAELARAQAEHRGPGGNPYDVRNGSKLSEKGGDGGNSAAYLLRRLARDYPETLDAYERGEFKSARAAAKAVGVIKDDAPLAILRRAWTRATTEERAAFLDWVQS